MEHLQKRFVQDVHPTGIEADTAHISLQGSRRASGVAFNRRFSIAYFGLLLPPLSQYSKPESHLHRVCWRQHQRVPRGAGIKE
jgi:hypothetical protein